MKSEKSSDHPANSEKVSETGDKEEAARHNKMPVDASEGGIEILVSKEETEMKG
jgi:hypothetical protein